MATKTRKTIGTNPLDAVVPDLRNIKSAPPLPVSDELIGNSTSAPGSNTGEDPNRKERLTIHLSAGLINRIKNAVFWTPGLTLADMGETALTVLVDELESEHGGPFESRTSELKGGRPLKRD